MNENIKKRLLEALKSFLEGEKVQWESGVSPEEWGTLFDLAIQHQILPMIYEAAYACPAFQSMPENQKDYLKHRMIQQVMIQGRKTAEFLSLYSRASGKRPYTRCGKRNHLPGNVPGAGLPGFRG